MVFVMSLLISGDYLSPRKCDILLFQEAHLINSDVAKLKNKMGGGGGVHIVRE